LNFLNKFSKNIQISNFRKSIQWKPSCSMHTKVDGRTDRLKDRQYNEANLYSKNHNGTHSNHCALYLTKLFHWFSVARTSPPKHKWFNSLFHQFILYTKLLIIGLTFNMSSTSPRSKPASRRLESKTQLANLCISTHDTPTTYN
jgi:hypothetical protein